MVRSEGRWRSTPRLYEIASKLAAVAGTYQRLKLREIDDLERWATQVVQVKAASLGTEPETERERQLHLGRQI